jgi:hypothetical protein
MFNCYIHKWSSGDKPCPACNQPVLTPSSTTSEKVEFKIPRTWVGKPEPDTKENKEDVFTWTDELVKEFVEGAIRLQNSLPNDVSVTNGMFYFKKEKKSKQQPIESKKERIEVTIEPTLWGMDFITEFKVTGKHKTLNWKKDFYQDKFPLIKEAIEKILNDEPSTEYDITYIGKKLFTKEQMDDAIVKSKENGFNAARLQSPVGGLIFQTASDYLNSLKDKQ